MSMQMVSMKGICIESSELEQRLRSAYCKILAERDSYPSKKALLIAIAAELDEVEEIAANAYDARYVSRRIDKLIAAAGQI